MSQQAVGVVDRIFTKEVAGGKKTFSFRLLNDANYYRLNFTTPAEVGIKEQTSVQFNFNQGQYGPDVDVRSIVITGANAAKPAGAKPPYQPKKFGSGGSKDDYWENKEVYDKTIREPLIHFQSSYNIAAQLVTAALAKDVLPLPAKAGAKFDAFMEMVHNIQEDIYNRIVRHKALLESGEAPQPSAGKALSALQQTDEESASSDDNNDWN